MQTLFDFKPTVDELQAIGIDSLTLSLRHGVNIDDPITESNYQVDEDAATFDIALLLTHRKDDTAAEFWKKIPERHQEWLLGFDDLITK